MGQRSRNYYGKQGAGGRETPKMEIPLGRIEEDAGVEETISTEEITNQLGDIAMMGLGTQYEDPEYGSSEGRLKGRHTGNQRRSAIDGLFISNAKPKFGKIKDKSKAIHTIVITSKQIRWQTKIPDHAI